MKKYLIFVNYYSDGWKIWSETDDFDEAIKIRDEIMGLGNPEVIIVKPVILEIIEKK